MNKNDWLKHTILQEERRVVKVVNVVGHPTNIEVEVNRYLDMGYDLGSSMMPYIAPDSNASIFVQQVIQFEEEEGSGITSRRPS